MQVDSIFPETIDARERVEALIPLPVLAFGFLVHTGSFGKVPLRLLGSVRVGSRTVGEVTREVGVMVLDLELLEVAGNLFDRFRGLVRGFRFDSGRLSVIRHYGEPEKVGASE